MVERHIRLNETEDVKEFVNEAAKCDFDIDISYNRIIIDAKSILGVTELGLGKVAKIVIHSDDEKIKIGFRKFFA